MKNYSDISYPGWELVRPLYESYAREPYVDTLYEIRSTDPKNPRHAALRILTIPKAPSETRWLLEEGNTWEAVYSLYRSRAYEILQRYQQLLDLNCPNVLRCEDMCCREVELTYDTGFHILFRAKHLPSLIQVLQEGMSESIVIRLAWGLCNALDACRQVGITNPDLRPQNIFRTSRGKFLLGYPASPYPDYQFQAPEIHWGVPDSPNGDIYSLGLVLYWALNKGRLPFASSSGPSLERQALDRRRAGDPLPRPAHGSAGLFSIVARACDPNPRQRYQNPQEIRQDLRALL